MSADTGVVRRHSLGASVLLRAIEDYRRPTGDFESAASFLYPATPEDQEHFDWAVSLAEGIDPDWLRDALDRFRPSWDAQRARAERRIA